MRCRVCGCTESLPCVNGYGVPCSWLGDDFCTACYPGTLEEMMLILGARAAHICASQLLEYSAEESWAAKRAYEACRL